MTLLKLPLKALALPVIAMTALLHGLCALATSLSSVFLNLLGTIAVLTAAGIWMFWLGAERDAYGVLGSGLLLFVLPHVANGLMRIVTKAGARLIVFLTT